MSPPPSLLSAKAGLRGWHLREWLLLCVVGRGPVDAHAAGQRPYLELLRHVFAKDDSLSAPPHAGRSYLAERVPPRLFRLNPSSTARRCIVEMYRCLAFCFVGEMGVGPPVRAVYSQGAR